MNFYEYFQSYRNYFWQFDEEAEWVTVGGDFTIMHMHFAKDVLQGMSEFPRWGSLVLAVAATSENSNILLSVIEDQYDDFTSWTEHERKSYKGTFKFLYSLSGLPKEFKTDQHRLRLLHFLLSKTHRSVKMKSSRAIYGVLASGEYDRSRLHVMEASSKQGYLLDLRWFEILQGRYATLQDLLDDMNALPKVNRVIELPEPFAQIPEKKVDAFVDELIDEPRTFYSGVLIRQIWAGLNIPLHNELPSQQPLGGVSDLTNKGDFDKLLISEFANDDLIFLSRLANNEALFLNREIPPQNHQQTRIFLLDVGLRNWGNPRSVGYATSIAIARHPRANMAYRAFAFGDTATEVFLDSTASIAEALDVISPAIDSSAGLLDFFTSQAVSKDDELFLVTTQESLNQPGMMRVLRDHGERLRYHVLADHNGALEIYKRRGKNKTLVQNVRLDLSGMARENYGIRKKIPLEDVVQIPFYLRPDSAIIEVIETEAGASFVRCKSNTLYLIEDQLTNVKKGLLPFPAKLPAAIMPHGYGTDGNGNHYHCAWKESNGSVVLTNLNTLETKNIVIPFTSGKQNMSVHFMKGAFYIFKEKVWRVGLSGDVESADDLLVILIERHRQFRRTNVFPWNQRTPLINLVNIAISRDQRLFISGHELVLNKNGSLYMNSKSDRIDNPILATPMEDTFSFRDGSTVRKLVGGVLLFQSSSKAISDFFVTSCVDKPLNMASGNAFAGDTFSTRHPLNYRMKISAFHGDILKLRTALQTHFPFSLATWHYCDDPTTLAIPPIEKHADMQKIASELTKAGATLQFETGSEAGPTIITPQEFYEGFIRPYIAHILNYAG